MKKTAKKPATAQKARVSLLELSSKNLKEVCGGKGVIIGAPERR